MSPTTPLSQQPTGSPSEQPDLQRTQQLSRDEVSTLTAQAVAASRDSDERWDAIRALHERGGRLAFEAGLQLCKATGWREQMTGADIVAQIGRTAEHPDPLYADESFAVLFPLLRTTRSTNVRNSALVALGHLGNPAAIPLIASFAADRSTTVRFGVAVALGGAFSAEPASTAALLELMRDADEEVRDWATFGLGVSGTADSAAIRDALAERLEDSSVDTRNEAMRALGLRHDLRALPALMEALRGGDVCLPVEEAACALLGWETEPEARTAAIYLEALAARYPMP